MSKKQNIVVNWFCAFRTIALRQTLELGCCSQPVVMSSVPSMDGLCPQGRELLVQQKRNQLAAAHSLRSLRGFTTRLTAACSQLANDLFVLAPHKKNSPLWILANAFTLCSQDRGTFSERLPQAPCKDCRPYDGQGS